MESEREETKRGGDVEEIFEVILVKNFPNIM